MLTFKAFQQVNSDRSNIVFPEYADWRTVDWSNALAGEAGELCNKVKKLKIDGGPNKMMVGSVSLKDYLGEEIADVITYAFLFASYLGLDAEEITRTKFNQVSLRKKSNINI